MKRLFTICLAPLVLVFAVAGCATQPGQSEAGYTALFDGTNLNSWTLLGNANWRLQDGLAQAELGSGLLVSKAQYGDFHLKAEFWVDAPANSGIFFRCADPKKIASAVCYEANIFDTRPDPSFGTGSIPGTAQASTVLKTGNQWNTMEVTAKGVQLTVVLNGIQTVNVEDSKYSKGFVALQYSSGVVKFRKVLIKPL